MRVKVGDTWYAAEPGQPIMVELTAQDRVNIAAMPADNELYAIFDEADGQPKDAMTRWMLEGSRRGSEK
jgi:hypothetical protein